MLFCLDRDGNIKGFAQTRNYKPILGPEHWTDGKVRDLVTPSRSANQVLKGIQKVLETQKPLLDTYDWIDPADPEKTIHKFYVRVLPIPDDPHHVLVIQSTTQFNHLI